MYKKCCVTGRRSNKLNKYMKYGDFNDWKFAEYVDSMGYIVYNAIKQGFNYFICGGAVGVDLDFAEQVIANRDEFGKDVVLEIAIPCEEQDKFWSSEDKERYKSIVNRADKITKVSEKYSSDCMMKRNKYMVNESELVFAFWDKKEEGGTWNTIKYAESIGKEINKVNIVY